MRPRIGGLALLVLALLPGAAGARGLTLGFFDPYFAAPTPGGAARLTEAAGAGAQIVRVQVSWADVAPARPAHAADPADPVYSWATVDGAVAAARTQGLQVLLSFTGAPRWAEGRNRPASANPGSWRPSPAAVGAFATALARRYASQVRYVQVWNEPNLSRYLAPQWDGRTPFSPGRFRAMLNAAYPGVHAAGVRLVTAGTAPYGDDPSPAGRRIRPVSFWRSVVRRRVRFDVLAHHPYAIRGPFDPALDADDVALPDVHRLIRIVARAVRRGRVLPRRTKPTWVTEVSWDSDPPDPDGVRTQARWAAEALFVLWRQGVRTVFWLGVRDQPPTPSYAATLQSGVYFLSGKPKRSRSALAFPFVCRPGTVWALAPAPGPVDIVAGSGRIVRHVRASADRIVYARMKAAGTVRARQGDRTSLACTSR